MKGRIIIRKKLGVCLILIFLLTNIHAVTLYAFEDNETRIKQLDHFLKNDARLNGVLASLSVRSATTGELIYNYNGDMLLRPASNLKLLTVAAALSTLGEDYSFHTEIFTDGKLKWKILNGHLYIKGKGDPTLLKSDIDRIVKDLKQKGIKMIRGDLVGDDQWYDNVRYSIDLPWSDETMGYGAQISALTFAPKKHRDPGTVFVKVHPGTSVGKKAIVTVEPHTERIKVINETKTVTDKKQNTLNVYREHGTNTIFIIGEIPLHAEVIENSLAVWEPTDYTLHLFKQSLKLSLDTNQLFLRDGSGISHVNLISANQISKLLYEVQGQEWFPIFFDSLPVAGAEDELEGGTLRYRMKGASTFRNVHAKTGTLTTVSSISGYTKTKAGETLIFSIILNNLFDDYSGKSIEDQMVTILAK